jgi:hypothetical protein
VIGTSRSSSTPSGIRTQLVAVQPAGGVHREGEEQPREGDEGDRGDEPRA